MTSVTTDTRVGTDLAGYRLESVVGRGGMGVVYLAQDLRLKRRVALKLISQELATDPRFRERFLTESEHASALDHSHVVPIYAAGETDGQLWIAMRYVDGEDLAALLAREAPLEPARAVELCDQVAQALAGAHAHGLVHRDVKPANVLVTEEGGREHCYLTDFGLARDTDADPGVPTHLSGTVDYTAPEQISHERTDARADVYSLGCVLYECLAGSTPFDRPRAMATLFAHAEEQPPSLHAARPGLPAAIDGVIERALAKDPADRYEGCTDLMAAARGALGLGQERRLSRRHLLLAGAAVLGVAAAAAVPAILLSGGEAAPEAAPAPAVPLPVTENTLLRMDPQSGEPIAAVPLGDDPTHLAAGDGSVWVVDTGERSLLQIDPETEGVVRTVDLSPAGPVELNPGEERVLAAAGAVFLGGQFNYATFESGVWRYDPASDSLARFADGGGEGLSLLAAGTDGVWIHNLLSDALTLHDPRTGRPLETTTVPLELATWWGLGDGDAWRWYAPPGSNSGSVERIDLTTGETVASIETDLVSVAELTVGEEGVWALGDGETLVRIDPATNRVDQTIPVGRDADEMALGAGYVWVGSSRDGTVTRVDPETADLLTIDVGGRAAGIAVADGGVWVIARPA